MTSKYLYVTLTSFRQVLAQRAGWIGRCTLFGVILVVFSHLWKTTFTKGSSSGMSAVDMTWYMAATEWIVLSVPNLHLAVEAEVRSGDVAYQLSRPYSFLSLQLAKGVGAVLAHLTPVGVTGFVLAWALSGSLPGHGFATLLAIPLGVLSALILVICGTAIGLTSFWLQDAGPVYWVWQKFLFTLGGLILPLAIYPDWLQAFARWTPFAALLNGPASLMLDPTPRRFAEALVLLLAWGGAALWAVHALHRHGLAVLDLNGG